MGSHNNRPFTYPENSFLAFSEVSPQPHVPKKVLRLTKDEIGQNRERFLVRGTHNSDVHQVKAYDVLLKKDVYGKWEPAHPESKEMVFVPNLDT